MSGQRVLTVFGTRPELIKLAPVIAALDARADVEQVVCFTAQHRTLVDSLLAEFAINPGIDLDLMRENQALADLTVRTITAIDGVLERVRPDWVVVQGDTTTVMATALTAFLRGVRVGHVEAGLRTGDLRQPFPEEFNRRVAAISSTLHFAPSIRARDNLLREGVVPSSVLVTGNTIVDSLSMLACRLRPSQAVRELIGSGPIVLITCHRRENFGAPLRAICSAIESLATQRPDVRFIIPVHPNPNVRGILTDRLQAHSNVFLTEPLDYADLVHVMKGSRLVLTDSGGIQEEAATLGVPVLVMRDKTERPEAVEAGCALLVGADCDRIVTSASELLENGPLRHSMAKATRVFGDGRAGERIASAICGETPPPFQPGGIQ